MGIIVDVAFRESNCDAATKKGDDGVSFLIHCICQLLVGTSKESSTTAFEWSWN